MHEDIFTRKIIEETLHMYLKRFRIKSIDQIRDNDMNSPKEKILLACIKDFCSFQIDFDLFISILGAIRIINPEKFDPLKQTPIEELCFHSLELQWYIRNDPEKYMHQLTKLYDYYKRNRMKLG